MKNAAVESWLDGWVSPVPTTNQGTSVLGFQRWFQFKEAFSPSFVFEIINDQPFTPKSILDPFSGSGTTALASQFVGIAPIAIEVNPFLADLTEAKLSIIDASELLHAKRALVKNAKLLRSESLLGDYSMPPTFIEPGVKKRWLFNKCVAIDIFSYRAAIEQMPQKFQRFAMVALGSILVEASNAVVNGKGRRYRKGWEKRGNPDIDRLMDVALSNMIEDAPLTTRKRTSGYTLLRGDARERLKDIDTEIDLALFSPPYPNSFDYTDVYNIELWMLGYLRSAQDNKDLRNKTLRSHVQTSRDFGFVINSPAFNTAYGRLVESRATLWDSRIPEMVGAYFADLHGVITSIEKQLSPNGQIELIVGDSQYSGVHFSVPTILGELLGEVGLRVKKLTRVRSMRSSAQQGGVLSLPESRITVGRA